LTMENLVGGASKTLRLRMLDWKGCHHCFALLRGIHVQEMCPRRRKIVRGSGALTS
jgi:hypothetical protein